MCINIHTLQALKTGFQCAKWIHICDTCTGQVFAEGFLSWIFTTISNGGNGYTGSPNKKTGIGLVSFVQLCPYHSTLVNYCCL